MSENHCSSGCYSQDDLKKGQCPVRVLVSPEQTERECRLGGWRPWNHCPDDHPGDVTCSPEGLLQASSM